MSHAWESGGAIEWVAILAARLSEPGADRGRILGAMGLDEATWRGIEGEWASRLRNASRRGEAALLEKFAEAWASARLRALGLDDSAAAAVSSRAETQPQPGTSETWAAATNEHAHSVPTPSRDAWSDPTPTRPASTGDAARPASAFANEATLATRGVQLPPELRRDPTPRVAVEVRPPLAPTPSAPTIVSPGARPTAPQQQQDDEEPPPARR